MYARRPAPHAGPHSAVGSTKHGIDLAKNVFQLHGDDDHGNMVVRKQLARPKLLPFVAQLAPCRIGIETCQGVPSQNMPVLYLKG
jgi:transposase